MLKELPAAIKNSVAVHVGCIAGAVQKEDYLAFIKEAGFDDVKVIVENTIPIESMINDPVVKTIMKNLAMSSEQFQKLAAFIASAKVFGIKPVL